ncbi:Hint domain-containing protein [Frigidibacter sp. MR17.24]|uniref:Hint domain-containing protein n=1 Tax=Frigidibacter sp. MR17.24 TaxID=3127345 RepID=UPI003012C43C
MTTYNILGVAPGQFQTVGGAPVQAGTLIYLNPEWTAATNGLTFSFTDGDANLDGDSGADEVGSDADQTLVVTDSGGSTLGSGKGYVEDVIIATAPDGSTIRLYRIEIAGVYKGIVIDGAVTPGVQYTITAVNDVTSSNAPLYSALDSLSYNQAAANSISGGSGNETLSGGAGSDTISGGAGNDSILGGDGDDSILMGSGQNTVYGGEGNDYVDDAVGPRLVGPNYIDGGGGADTLISGDGNDTIYGGDGNDSILGEGGNDYIDGGAGDDDIQAGAGANTVYGGAGNDRIDDIKGVVGDPGPNEFHGGDGHDTIYSGNGNDTVFGDAGNDYIYAEGGNDLIDGGDGNDWVQAGSGDDTIFGGTGNDILLGEAGNDAIFGGAGDDSIAGGTGNDTLWGDTGADTFYVISGDGNDTIYAGDNDSAIDRLDFSYMGSSDSLNLNMTGFEMGTYTVNGGTATGQFWEIESVQGGAGNDTIDGSGGMANMMLSGGAGDDVILGGTGNDTLSGGTGNDTLTGGTGDDVMTGGTGIDHYVFSPSGGQDRITDFDMTANGAKTTDQLDVSGLTNGSGGPVKARDVTVIDDGFGNALIIFPDGGSVTLTGVSAATVRMPGQLQAMGIPCLVAGTPIDTPDGPRRVEDLRPGDMVETVEAGPQPLLWVGQRPVGAAEVAADPRMRPVEIGAGALDNAMPIRMSRLHSVAVNSDAGWRLVRAGLLAELGWPGVQVIEDHAPVVYYHLLMPGHTLLRAGGLAVESFWPGPNALAGLGAEMRRGLLLACPTLAPIVLGLEPPERLYGGRAAPAMGRREVDALCRAAIAA